MIRFINKLTILAVTVVLLGACNADPSLQKYYVEKQEDADFVSVDISPNLLISKDSELTGQERKTLETIKKLNVLALPNKAENSSKYEAEKQQIDAILSNDAYKTLIAYKTKDGNATFKYLGEETSLKELVVFADSDEKGLALVRIWGKDMNPTDIVQMLKTINPGALDLSALESIKEQL